jgi:hypothetical protein
VCGGFFSSFAGIKSLLLKKGQNISFVISVSEFDSHTPMNKILFWSFSVALAGLLFGFDTIVISGADQKLQELWHTSDVFHGFVVMASALWGTVVGAMTAESLPINTAEKIH